MKIVKIRKICNKELTDLVAGPMNLNELKEEIFNTVFHRSQDYMVILIEKRPELLKYHSTIYITKEDFKRYK